MNRLARIISILGLSIGLISSGINIAKTFEKGYKLNPIVLVIVFLIYVIPLTYIISN